MDGRSITKHYFISGRVQGVGFRAFVRRTAGGLKLSGWVRNLPDGRVEAMVHGPIEAMDNFDLSLRRGPPQGEVSNVEVRAGKNEDLPGEFEIRKDGR